MPTKTERKREWLILKIFCSSEIHWENSVFLVLMVPEKRLIGWRWANNQTTGDTLCMERCPLPLARLFWQASDLPPDKNSKWLGRLCWSCSCMRQHPSRFQPGLTETGALFFFFITGNVVIRHRHWLSTAKRFCVGYLWLNATSTAVSKWFMFLCIWSARGVG